MDLGACVDTSQELQINIKNMSYSDAWRNIRAPPYKQCCYPHGIFNWKLKRLLDKYGCCFDDELYYLAGVLLRLLNVVRFGLIKKGFLRRNIVRNYYLRDNAHYFEILRRT